MNRFGSRDGDDLFRGDALSHLYSIVSIQHGIPPESQITLYDELHMFIDTVMSSILLPHIYFSLIPEEYERFNDADSAITSVVYLESLNPSIYHCFNLIDHGIQPSNLLHENKEMKHLQKIFLKSIHGFNGGKAKDGMSHCFQCKERWFDTVKGQRICHEVVSKHLVSYICKCCGKHNGLYSKSNDTDPWHQLDHLKLTKLNDIDLMLPSKVHSYMRVYMLQGKLIFNCVPIYKTYVCLQ